MTGKIRRIFQFVKLSVKAAEFKGADWNYLTHDCVNWRVVFGFMMRGRFFTS